MTNAEYKAECDRIDRKICQAYEDNKPEYVEFLKKQRRQLDRSYSHETSAALKQRCDKQTRKALETVQRHCQRVSVVAKGDTEHSDYAKGRREGMLDAFAQISGLVTSIMRGDCIEQI